MLFGFCINADYDLIGQDSQTMSLFWLLWMNAILSSIWISSSSPVRPMNPFGSKVSSLYRGGSIHRLDKTPIKRQQEWILGQLCLRQQRALALSSALTDGGFEVPVLVDRSKKSPKMRKGWECAQESDDEDDMHSPKSCLIMGEVLPGSKCVSPQGTDKWVSLWELNKMRRNQPNKVSGLWYDQFEVDCSEFTKHAGPISLLLNFALDTKFGLRFLLVVGSLLVSLLLRMPLGFLMVKFLTSSLLWNQYMTWSQLVYAPLPAKLYIAGILSNNLLSTFHKLETLVRDKIVEAECDLIELVMPVTINP